jgi:Plasmid pRiA4b ORF-3-like protein
MTLLYDFGDNWTFTVKLERVDAPGSKSTSPRIMKRQGKSPVQYEQWDAW